MEDLVKSFRMVPPRYRSRLLDCARIFKGKKRKDVVKSCGIPHQILTGYFNGYSKLSDERLMRIIYYLEMEDVLSYIRDEIGQ
jgi:hypothetical protein